MLVEIARRILESARDVAEMVHIAQRQFYGTVSSENSKMLFLTFAQKEDCSACSVRLTGSYPRETIRQIDQYSLVIEK